MSERIRIRPFIEKWLFSWCLAKLHLVFGLSDAMHHIFVKGSREMQALETECGIWYDPERVPQQEHQRGCVCHCFLAWYSLLSQGSSTSWYLPVRKGHFSLFLLEQAAVLQHPRGFFERLFHAVEKLNPYPLSSASLRQSLATSNGMSEVQRLEAMSSSVCKHPCSMFPSALKTNGKRKSRALRQLSVKLTNSSQNSPWSQCRHRRKACT